MQALATKMTEELEFLKHSGSGNISNSVSIDSLSTYVILMFTMGGGNLQMNGNDNLILSSFTGQKLEKQKESKARKNGTPESSK